MLKVFIALILIISSFFGGLFYERFYSREEAELHNRIADLEQAAEALQQHNTDLLETMSLVKRQIQTDRLAYESLQEIVEESEQERESLREQLESQRELLKKLRDRLEKSE